MMITFAPVRFICWMSPARCDGDGGTPGFGSMNPTMFMPVYSAKYRQLVCYATTGLPLIVASCGCQRASRPRRAVPRSAPCCARTSDAPCRVELENLSRNRRAMRVPFSGIEPVVRIARAGARRPGCGRRCARGRRARESPARRRVPGAAAIDLRIARAVEQQRHPPALEIEPDEREHVGLPQLQHEARLRLDEVRVLVALAMCIAVTRLPPTACAMSCRSVVLVTMRSFCAEQRRRSEPPAAAPRMTRRFMRLILVRMDAAGVDQWRSSSAASRRFTRSPASGRRYSYPSTIFENSLGKNCKYPETAVKSRSASAVASIQS